MGEDRDPLPPSLWQPAGLTAIIPLGQPLPHCKRIFSKKSELTGTRVFLLLLSDTFAHTIIFSPNSGSIT